MHFEMFLSAMDRYMVYGEHPQSRLKAIHIENDMDMIIKLSYFLDYAVRMKKKNRNIWLFVDGADELLYSTIGSDFLILYITDREPGEGIILTSTSNIAFTDRLGDEEHLFFKLFY